MSRFRANGEGDAPSLVEVVNNRVYFYTKIDHPSSMALNKALREAARNAAWDENQKEVKPVVWLHLNSEGGDVFSMFAIADTIQALPVPVHTVIEGIAGSGGSIVALAGAKRYITPNSFILIHQVHGGGFGNYEELKDDIRARELIMRRMIRFYACHTKLTKKEVAVFLKHDWWMNAKQAKKNGFVDKVLK